MNTNNPFEPNIVWRPRLSFQPERNPVEIDVLDGRAEYVLSGPYRMTEGASIQVRNGQVLYSSGVPTPK